MGNILASAIKDKAHLKAFDDMMAERFAEIDISALIPNLYDTVPAAALPYLARQYNLLGYNGWRFADTEQKQRDLLKNWAAVKKLKGTMAGIREALKVIDMEPIDIRIDPYDLYCDGVHDCNGHFTCGGPNPFHFEISISTADFPTLEAQTVIDMMGIIREFKAARDLLIAINVDVFEEADNLDGVDLSDDLHIEVTDGMTNPVYDI